MVSSTGKTNALWKVRFLGPIRALVCGLKLAYCLQCSFCTGSAWLPSGGTSPYSGFRPSSAGDSAPPSTLAFSGGRHSENGQTSWVEQVNAAPAEVGF
jgi:hypothetical protein